uniref:Monocyte to macrophage differentiation associated 2 n=1 Tax=Sinocyclocheilus grahami TaxID=75366 RepID=A0A672LU24_SINGR
MNNRAPSNKRYQPTEYEHAANCATHALWIIPSIVGGILLYLLSDDHWEEISAWLYGAGLSSLFIISTVFHTISWKKSHLRSVEHCFHMCDRMVIYFFIAASYTPWLTLRDLGPWAAHMRWVVWVMASGGTAYVFFFHERYASCFLRPLCYRFKVVELVCYVAMVLHIMFSFASVIHFCMFMYVSKLFDGFPLFCCIVSVPFFAMVDCLNIFVWCFMLYYNVFT